MGLMDNSWKCKCGNQNTGLTCPACGTSHVEMVVEKWNEEDKPKIMNRYHFNFTLDTYQKISEKTQQTLARLLLTHFEGQILLTGFHPSARKIDNEYYMEKIDPTKS